MSRNLASLESLDQALAMTRDLLWPPSCAVWIRILVITLFIGGGLFNPFPGDITFKENASLQDLLYSGSFFSSDLVIVLGILLLLGLGLYSLVSSVFQFVFVDCLSRGVCHLSGSFIRRITPGLRLFGFYLLLLGFVIMAVILVTGLFCIPLIQSGDHSLPSMLMALVISLIALLLLLLPVWIIAILTTDFVVPIMVVKKCGVFTGWKAFYHIFRGTGIDLWVFVGIKIVLVLVTGALLGGVIFLTSLPFDLPGLVISGDLNPFLSLTVGQLIRLILFSLVSLLISLAILAPVITFLRYYSLIMVGKINPDFRLIPE